jgi:hypothetical protein
MVTLVLNDPEQEVSLQLETDVVTPKFLAQAERNSVDEAWSEQDSRLLQRLIARRLPSEHQADGALNLNLSDTRIVELLYITAAAHFAYPFEREEVIRDLDTPVLLEPYEVGDVVALHTFSGYRSAMVVRKSSFDAQAVLLEYLRSNDDRPATLHDLVNIELDDALPVELSYLTELDEDSARSQSMNWLLQGNQHSKSNALH